MTCPVRNSRSDRPERLLLVRFTTEPLLLAQPSPPSFLSSEVKSRASVLISIFVAFTFFVSSILQDSLLGRVSICVCALIGLY